MSAKSKTKKQLRKERELEAHRQEMLEAGERVFVRYGYYKATVEQIANEAGFAVGTLYNFFGSKRQLYREVFRKIALDFIELFENEVLCEDNPEKAISRLIEIRIRDFQKHKGFFRVFLQTTPVSQIDSAWTVPEDCKDIYDKYINRVTDIFRKGVESGVYDQMDPFYLTLSFEGILNSFMSYWSRYEPSESIETRIRKLRDAFIPRIKVKLTNESRVD